MGNEFDLEHAGAGTPSDFGDWVEEYEALTGGFGMVTLGAWTQIELTGRDAIAFLNRLATNKIAALAPGESCETFLLDVKAHVVAHVLVYRGDGAVMLFSVPGEGAKIAAHLDHYLITDDVTVRDRSAERRVMLAAGRQAGEVMRRAENVSGRGNGTAVLMRGVDFTGPGGTLVSCEHDMSDNVWTRLVEAGAKPCGMRAFEAARIEAGWPWYGRDITAENLAQEAGRDERAISLDKGCYLGQEPVARIATRGHVNRRLVRLRGTGPEVPAAGSELRSGEHVAGRVTSATFSPRSGTAVALGYVERAHLAPGTWLESTVGTFEVAE